jgi:hypothetical protein
MTEYSKGCLIWTAIVLGTTLLTHLTVTALTLP